MRQFLFPVHYEHSTYFYILKFFIFSRETFVVLNQKTFAPYEANFSNFLNSSLGYRYSSRVSRIRLEFPSWTRKEIRRSTTNSFSLALETSRRICEKLGNSIPGSMKASLVKESKRITDRNSPRISVARFRVSLLWESSVKGLPMGTTCRYPPRHPLLRIIEFRTSPLSLSLSLSLFFSLPSTLRSSWL